MIYVHDPAELSEAAAEAGERVCEVCGHIFGEMEDYYVTDDNEMMCEECARDHLMEIMEDWRRSQ